MRRRSFSFFLVFVWSFGLTAITAAGSMLTARWAPRAAADIVTVGAWQALPLLVGASVVLARHSPGQSGGRALALRPTHAPLLALAAVLGLALTLPVQSLMQYADPVGGLTDVELVQRALLYRTDTAARVLLLMLVGSCLIPTAQEIFFHGAVFGVLRRDFSAAVSAVVSALGFAVASTNVRQWPVLLLVGAVGSFLRVTSGSLLAPLTMNVSLNAAILLALVLRVTSVTRSTVWPWPAMLGSWLAGMALVVLVGRVSRKSAAAADARADDDAD